MGAAEDIADRLRSIGRGVAVTATVGTVAGAAAAGYGLWEKNQFVLRRESLAILPPGTEPFRILHLSDIHFVPGQRRKAEWLHFPGRAGTGPGGQHRRQPQPRQGH